MRVGIDSYSYHRLLGELRPGERPAPGQGLGSTAELLAEMAGAGAEVLSLETVFLGPPARLDVPVVRAGAGACEIALAWGHPLGLRWGTDPSALDELCAWIALAPALGVRIVRCVAAGPALRGAPAGPRLRDTIRALRRATAHATHHGVVLALENHGDVDGDELSALLDAIPELRVCLDTANALRVGDDPVTLTRRVAERIAVVHLKDVEGAPPAGSPAGGTEALASGPPATSLTGPASVPYGAGVVDLEAVLAALPQDPRLPVCVELGHLGGGVVDERAMVREGVAWLRARRLPLTA